LIECEGFTAAINDATGSLMHFADALSVPFDVIDPRAQLLVKEAAAIPAHLLQSVLDFLFASLMVPNEGSFFFYATWHSD
jgi:hypothetical protein